MQRKSREWIFRIKQEAKHSSSAYFVTLTYDDAYLIWSESGVPTLSKQDVKDYIRALRKTQKKKGDLSTIRYFLAGEYAPETHRPHYHIILLNSYQKLIEDTWTKGIVHVGTVTNDSIAYNTKYILKENQAWQDKYKEDSSFQKEFSLMSKGIGKSYLDNPEVTQYHKKNLAAFMTDEQGFKYSMPRYYKEKIFNEKELRKIKNTTEKERKEAQEEQHQADLKKEEKNINPFEERQDQEAYKQNNFKRKLKSKQSKL